MKLSRYITEEAIKLDMATRIEPLGEDESEAKWLQSAKEQVLAELVSLLDESHRIGNYNKLLIDFINRERKATTALGQGIAVPHIRSMQAKDFMLAFARSPEGYPFDSPDSKPVHLFFIMAAPPYEDSLYLKAFKALVEKLQYDGFRQELLEATHPGEVIRAIRAME
jgi:mannitol/fructose-specific phosphotransferase system IIA component (Ntr-type)